MRLSLLSTPHQLAAKHHCSGCQRQLQPPLQQTAANNGENEINTPTVGKENSCNFIHMYMYICISMYTYIHTLYVRLTRRAISQPMKCRFSVSLSSISHTSKYMGSDKFLQFCLFFPHFFLLQ